MTDVKPTTPVPPEYQLAIRQLEVAMRRLRLVGELLAENGCDCSCGHAAEGHDEGCERCLACRVEKVLQGDHPRIALGADDN
jgi:hypothetical protein